jgi:transcriptional regulator with XRE-family HTH domain
MKPSEFKHWRERHALTQEQAGDALGISLSAVANYERDTRRGDGEPTVIPRFIEMACAFFDQRARVKANIKGKIVANGRGAITDPILREILLEIVDLIQPLPVE